MALIYKYSESNAKPPSLEIDKYTVFLRKDFVEEIRDGWAYWVYQEAKMSHDEFNEYVDYVTKQNAIKGVNDSDNIVNLLNGQENGDNNQLIIMEAIADLYDAIASIM